MSINSFSFKSALSTTIEPTFNHFKILLVDDDHLALKEMEELLQDNHFEVIACDSVTSALGFLKTRNDIALVISDLRMPLADGLEFIKLYNSQFRKDNSLIGFIIISGYPEINDALTAIKLGVLDFLRKPVSSSQFIQSVNNGLEKVKSDRNLESQILEIRSKVYKLESELEEKDEEFVQNISLAAELKDPETGNHINRIGSYAEQLARLLGYSRAQQEQIYLAAPLHDVGKIGIPEHILLKAGKLSDDEFEIMKLHTSHGYKILNKSKSPTFKMAAEIAHSHHERWDGSGYPFGLKGKDIPWAARITSIVDTYDALRSERPYKEAFSHEKTIDIMLKGDGRTLPAHFDPEMLEMFVENHLEFENIYNLLKG